MKAKAINISKKGWCGMKAMGIYEP